MCGTMKTRKKENKMAPLSFLKKIKAAKPKTIFDDVSYLKKSSSSKENPVFVMHVNYSLPPVTDEERARWEVTRRAEKNKTFAERIQAMKQDGRLYHMNGVWRRRADEDAEERVWLNKKVLELFKEEKIMKVDGFWYNV